MNIGPGNGAHNKRRISLISAPSLSPLPSLCVHPCPKKAAWDVSASNSKAHSLCSRMTQCWPGPGFVWHLAPCIIPGHPGATGHGCCERNMPRTWRLSLLLSLLLFSPLSLFLSLFLLNSSTRLPPQTPCPSIC